MFAINYTMSADGSVKGNLMFYFIFFGLIAISSACVSNMTGLVQYLGIFLSIVLVPSVSAILYAAVCVMLEKEPSHENR